MAIILILYLQQKDCTCIWYIDSINRPCLRSTSYTFENYSGLFYWSLHSVDKEATTKSPGPDCVPCAPKVKVDEPPPLSSDSWRQVALVALPTLHRIARWWNFQQVSSAPARWSGFVQAKPVQSGFSRFQPVSATNRILLRINNFQIWKLMIVCLAICHRNVSNRLCIVNQSLSAWACDRLSCYTQWLTTVDKPDKDLIKIRLLAHLK